MVLIFMNNIPLADLVLEDIRETRERRHSCFDP